MAVGGTALPGSIALLCAAADWGQAAEMLGAVVENVSARTWPEGVRTIAAAGLAWLEQHGGQRDPADSLRVRDMLYGLRGMVAEARTALDDSVRLVEGTERDRDAVLIRLELALLATETRDLDAARQHLNAIKDNTPPRYSSGGF